MPVRTCRLRRLIGASGITGLHRIKGNQNFACRGSQLSAEAVRRFFRPLSRNSTYRPESLGCQKLQCPSRLGVGKAHFLENGKTVFNGFFAVLNSFNTSFYVFNFLALNLNY